MRHFEENVVTARDLMRRDVATLSPDDSIESALALFEEARIGGAPVVANGRLVGMLTMTDVSRPEHVQEGRIRTEGDYVLAETAGEEQLDELDLEETFRKEDYSPALLGSERVGQWMSEGVVTVPPEASLRAVCQTMVDHGIHRLCVTEGSKLVGLVTTFDVVRHVARAPAVVREPVAAPTKPRSPTRRVRPQRKRVRESR